MLLLDRPIAESDRIATARPDEARLNIPEAEVQDRTAAARGELQAGVRAVLDKLSESLTCALKGTDLSTVSAEHLAEHLVSCDTCTGNVELMHSLGDVPGWLRSVENSPGDASRVEQVLASANGRGTDELSRLLYEMFRACMAQRPDTLGTRQFISPPARKADLERDAATVASRTGSPSPAGGDADAIRAARACAATLAQVSPGYRAEFALGTIAAAEGKFADAVVHFERVSSDAVAPRFARLHATLNMLEPLEQLQRDDEFVAMASALDAANFERHHVHWNVAVFHAVRGNAAGWSSAASAFSAELPSRPDQPFWKGLIDAFAKEHSSALGLTEDEFKQALRWNELADSEAES